MLDTKLDSKDQDKKDMLSIFGLFLALFVGAGILLTFKHYGKPVNHFILKRIIDNILILKASYFFMIMLGAILSPSKYFKKKFKDSNPLVIGALMLTVSVLLFFPPKGGLLLQKIILIINFVALSLLLVIPKIFFSIWKSSNLNPDDAVKNINTKSGNIKETFWFNTKKGVLKIVNACQGVITIGGPGAGKSKTHIEPMIFQSIEKEFGVFVYDFKGDPEPTLGKWTYNCVKYHNGVQKFALISFTNLSITNKTNPLNPIYINSELEARELAVTLVKNLSPQYIKKSDFWGDNFMIAVQGMIMFLKYIQEQTGKRVCTLPHLVVLSLQNFGDIQPKISEIDEIRMVTNSVYGADAEAKEQIQGIQSTLQSAMAKLFDKKLFWVLNPLTDEEEISLDINVKGSPIALTVCSKPKLNVASTVKKNINEKGKEYSLFVIDELPTLYIPDLHELPNTGRSNGVVTLLGIQDYSQLENMYDKEADMIMGSMGNQFIGMVNNVKTVENFVKLIGERRITDFSYSESENGITESFRNSKESILLNSDISNQPKGHFAGKIANGDPAVFFTQFNMLDVDSSLEEENLESIPIINHFTAEEEKQIIEENYENIKLDIETIMYQGWKRLMTTDNNYTVES